MLKSGKYLAIISSQNIFSLKIWKVFAIISWSKYIFHQSLESILPYYLGENNFSPSKSGKFLPKNLNLGQHYRPDGKAAIFNFLSSPLSAPVDCLSTFHNKNVIICEILSPCFIITGKAVAFVTDTFPRRAFY